MVEKLYFPADIAARYGVTERTARTYMRRMRHQERPLAVTESALAAWEAKRTIDPDAPRQVKSNRLIPGSQFGVVTRIPRYKEVFGKC